MLTIDKTISNNNVFIGIKSQQLYAKPSFAGNECDNISFSLPKNKGPIVIATDAWRVKDKKTGKTQMNGVVTTLEKTVEELKSFGYRVKVITPDDFTTFRPPGTEPGVKLALFPGNTNKMRRMLNEINPVALLIPAEGPVGWMARQAAIESEMSFTTTYNSQYPEYTVERFKQISKYPEDGFKKIREFAAERLQYGAFRVPPKIAEIQGFALDRLQIGSEIKTKKLSLSEDILFPPKVQSKVLDTMYVLEKLFHKSAEKVLVTTNSMKEMLKERGFKNLAMWDRGVDTKLFNPSKRVAAAGLYKDLDPTRGVRIEGPVLINVGRVSPEKNLKRLLDINMQKDLRLPKGKGTIVIVGDGPSLKSLRKEYKDKPHIIFVGRKSGEDLAKHYASADVFAFPSKTDTFGLVMLEGNASGLPVAAYKGVPGPQDIYGKNGSEAAVLSDNFADAVKGALKLKPEDGRKFAETRSWKNATIKLLRNLFEISNPEETARAS